MACLLLLSFSRLAIHISPYKFDAWNHSLMSISCYILLPVVPIVDNIYKYSKYGHNCDFYADFIVKSIYNENIGVTPSTSTSSVVTRNISVVLIFSINIGIFLHKQWRNRNVIVPAGVLCHSQESR
jgi:hypothetical protein